MPVPLLVHVLFDPHSTSARELALFLYAALNDDPAAPGLRVPTVFAPEDGSGLPPAALDLTEAVRNVVVVLADDRMAVDRAVAGGRRTWSQFVGDTWERCQAPHARFLPVQLTEHAWPLDERLAGVNFLRAVLQPPAARPAWVARAVIIETCRYLEGLGRGQQLPLRLFLSHAKQDIGAAPKVFDAIVEHLQVTQPIETWIDSAKIEAGSQFDDAIEKGVSDAVVLVLATRSYASRPWCRKELLLAKRYQRPFVVIEALEGLEPRGFPYAGNAPRLRWSDDCAARAVDLVLKETLRHLHVRTVLGRCERPGDEILAAAPELATVVRLPRGTSVLYPDPPIGDEEADELKPLGIRLETPLQRAADGRPLARVPIVLSISDSADLARHGLVPSHLNAAMVEISRQLLVRGASLQYGGHLGPDGYTVALFEMARAYSAMSRLPLAERIVNDVGWPLPYERAPVSTLAQYQKLATFRRIPRPAGLEALEPATFVEEPEPFPPDSPVRRYAWARGMTAMRESQTRSAKARVLLGGRIGPTPIVKPDGRVEQQWYAGRIPGVVEEAAVSLKAGQPLYIVGAFGGAAELVIDLLHGSPRREFTWEFQKAAPHSEGMRALYDQHGPAWQDYDSMAREFADAGVAAIAARNGLTVQQNLELFVSRDPVRIVELLLEGLTSDSSRNV